MADVKIPEGKLATLIVGGKETTYAPGKAGDVYFTDKFKDIPCDYKARGIDDYRAALLIGPEGIVREMSVPAAVQGGSFDDKGAVGIKVESDSHDFSALILDKGSYKLTDAKLEFVTDSDGSKVSDFTGYGSVIAAFNGSKLELENVDIESVGVAKPAVFCDDNSDIVFKNSKIRVMGGKLYDGYINSADCTVMVAPPWVLGITGSARGTNLMGSKSSTTVVDSDMQANHWGVLSTDGGANMQLIVIDSDMTLLGDETDDVNPFHARYGSGYGTYIICNAREEFYGVHMKVGTYAAVLRGGTAVYKSSRGEMKVTSPTTGEVLYQGQGKDRKTVIDSDAFGFMAHGGGELTVTDGTVVNSQFSTFLVKIGGVTMNVLDGAVVNSGNGVIAQLMDDDDAITGLDFTSKYMLTFNTEFHEAPGWPSENGRITSKMELPPPPPMPMPEMPSDEYEDEAENPFGPMIPDVIFNAEDAYLNGSLYNGTGYFGQPARPMYVNLGRGAFLNGTISATETMHVNEYGAQNTRFTMDQYYYLGHIANRPFFNGDNTVEVKLSDGAVWKVTADGMLTSLTVEAGCKLIGSVTVDNEAVVPEAGRTYTGMIRVAPVY